MKKRNLVISGVYTRQSRLAKLRFDLKRVRENGSYFLSGRAREKVEREIDLLELQGLRTNTR